MINLPQCYIFIYVPIDGSNVGYDILLTGYNFVTSGWVVQTHTPVAVASKKFHL